MTFLSWFGSTLIVVAFATQSKLPKLYYLLMNLVGSGITSAYCVVAGAWPLLPLQLTWFIVAALLLTGMYRHRNA
jgi:hypothetical protein